MLNVGDAAPDFRLSATGEDETIRLHDLRGQPVVLYFYPKDDTPGCTLEAQGFRDYAESFESLGVALLGISPDDMTSHQRFTDAHELNFPLLADIGHRIAEAYGVWQQKEHEGRAYMGIARTTFLIDKEGILHHIWRDVHVKAHAEDVFSRAETLVLRS